ncbi:hypothetical protein V5O48_018536 [Marasmius crinis-equi]|uniref:Uncharacterized protein n=1 Tax=Marasmius crinis-equi TaxID=585013 RepID=A0ABR3EKW1_9AGAR
MLVRTSASEKTSGFLLHSSDTTEVLGYLGARISSSFVPFPPSAIMSAQIAGASAELSEEQHELQRLRDQLSTLEAEIGSIDDSLDKLQEMLTCRHPDCGLIFSKPHV